MGEGQGEGYFAKDVAEAVAGWLSYLGAERRYAENTLEAYERDARQFLSFLSASQPASLARLNALTPGDFRAFLAFRRDDGAGSRSLARTLSALRSLFPLSRTDRLFAEPQRSGDRPAKIAAAPAKASDGSKSERRRR